MKIILVGLNHRTAPIALREQLAMPDCALGMALEEMTNAGCPSPNGNGSGPTTSTLKETVILSTCNRLEVYALTGGEATVGWDVIEQFLSHLQGIPLEELHPHLYFKEGQEVVSHLMRVAAGLDSMVLGEPQILGQVSKAHSEARKAGTAGPVLSHLFDLSCHAGKRARTETEIGRHTTSISHAAAQLIAGKVEDLERCHLLFIGAGEMIDVAAQALQARGAQELNFINRTYSRAQGLAQEYDGRALNWYHLPAALAMADVVVTATGAPHVVIHKNDVQPILNERAGRHLLFVDIAVPRDVEVDVGQLTGVERYDIDHFQSTVDANLAMRQAAVPGVERIVDREAMRFDEWLQGRQVLPVLVELRRKVKGIADRELGQNMGQLYDLDPDSQAKVAKIVHRIVGKMLHEPTVRLKSAAAQGNGVEYAQAVRDLFDLPLVQTPAADPAAPTPPSNGARIGDSIDIIDQGIEEAAPPAQ